MTRQDELILRLLRLLAKLLGKGKEFDAEWARGQKMTPEELRIDIQQKLKDVTELYKP